MIPLDDLWAGFATALDPQVLILMLLGVLLGTVVGVLPGIGPVGAMAILLPISFGLNPVAAILMLIGVFFGSMYGGSTTAILTRIPGDASSVIATIDGHEMAKRGRAGAALALTTVGSFFAGTLAIILLQIATPQLVALTLQFGPAEYLALTLFALFVLSRLTPGALAPAMLAGALGLALATIGVDAVSGVARFTGGYRPLSSGIEVVAVAVGLYGLTEIMESLGATKKPPIVPHVRFRDLYPSRAEWREAIPAMFRGGFLGFVMGLVPGPAAVMSSYASYALERKISKHPERFGKGAVAGVAGPEAANNGASGGGMVPLLLLGVPFAPPTALLLAGFTIQGVAPGPLLVSSNPEVFWGIVAGMYVANILLLVLNLPLVGIFASLLRMPGDLLLAGVALLAVVGTYAARNNIVDVFVLVAIGGLGYLMSQLGLPRATLLLAFVIAGVMEQSLGQSVTLVSTGSMTLGSRPIAAVLLATTAAVLVAPYVIRIYRRTRQRSRGLA